MADSYKDIRTLFVIIFFVQKYNNYFLTSFLSYSFDLFCPLLEKDSFKENVYIVLSCLINFK